MPAPKLIGLYSNAPGCGKSTVAECLLEDFGFTALMPFAMPLRKLARMVLDDLGVKNAAHYLMTPEGKETKIPELGVTGRWMLQSLGTDWGRQCIHPELWLRIWRRKAEDILSHEGTIVVDDVRFQNEANLIKELGGQVWRVDRPGVAPAPDHASERNLLTYLPDRIVLNNGTIQELALKIEAAFYQ